MKTCNTILIAGASGFLGRSLTNILIENGYEVVALSRRVNESSSSKVVWNPQENYIDIQKLLQLAPHGFDAVINLAGENLASKRWDADRMEKLKTSRINATKLIAHKISDGTIQTSVFLSASATGFYGDRGDEILTEESSGGTGFLAELCRAWENASELDNRTDIRVAKLRTGLVLDTHEGALARMLPIFKMGMGGKLGSGMHFYPWIVLEDFLRAILYVIEGYDSNKAIEGAVNIVSQNPVRNSEFTFAFAKALNRPSLLTVPRLALTLALGKIANEALLTSQRAIPKMLYDAGFEFKYATINTAMLHILGQS